MDRLEVHQNFISFMERERAARGWSIDRMADAVHVPPSTYRNIIYGRTQCIDIDIAVRLYELTGRWMYEMVGYTSTSSPVVNLYTELSPRGKMMIRRIYDVIKEISEDNYGKKD